MPIRAIGDNIAAGVETERDSSEGINLERRYPVGFGILRGRGWRWCLLDPFGCVALFVRELHRFFARGWWGYADSDVWSLDTYLATWLPGALRQIKNNSLGYPGGMGRKEWRETVEKMAVGFEAARRFAESWDEDDLKTANEGLDLFRRWFFNLWD